MLCTSYIRNFCVTDVHWTCCIPTKPAPYDGCARGSRKLNPLWPGIMSPGPRRSLRGTLSMQVSSQSRLGSYARSALRIWTAELSRGFSCSRPPGMPGSIPELEDLTRAGGERKRPQGIARARYGAGGGTPPKCRSSPWVCSPETLEPKVQLSDTTECSSN